LARWDVGVIERRLLSADNYRLQQTEVQLPSGRTTGYGLGVFVYRAGDHRVIGHNGIMPGFLAENRIYPDDGAAVVVLVNAGTGYAGPATMIADELERIAIPDLPVPPAQQQQRRRPAPETANSETTRIARGLVDQLRSGRLDDARLTPDAAADLAANLADYQASLASLGDPASFTLLNRGGNDDWDASIHEARWPDRRLLITMFRDASGQVSEFQIIQPDWPDPYLP
jgi:hypothetical protein